MFWKIQIEKEKTPPIVLPLQRLIPLKFWCLPSKGFVCMYSILIKMGSCCVRQFLLKMHCFHLWEEQWLALPLDHIQFLKGIQWTIENLFWDYYFIWIFHIPLSSSGVWYFTAPWSQGQVRHSLASFPSAEFHSLPRVTLSVACHHWPTYLLYFYGTFFWNNNNKNCSVISSTRYEK